MSEQEKKDKKFGMILSAIVHAMLIAVFLLLVAWREPDPPIPEYGIELNLGFQDEGSGDTERDAETQIEDTSEEELPDGPEETEQVESTEEEVIEETTPPETEQTSETQEATENQQETQEVMKDPVTQNESEVVVEEKKEETQETQQENTTAQKKEEKPVVKPKPTVDNRALMGGKKTNTEKTDQSSNNQGDSRAVMGNQGSKEGQKETDGKSKDGADIGGVSYSLDGWKWQQPPAKKDDSQIDGVIKFAIEVDDRGDVLRVSIVPGTTISDNTIVEFYRKQVQQLRFVQLDPGKSAAAISKGTVTFVIKTN